ncbi:nad dependent epimerase dehydratase [Colletotrichum sojae]|uniref:Nad dependent epimerase dehydratase n=1 Tax=Colletotrichum sojae TaxID=2175907 RepID=A0A8H6JEU8_9PEZI|nr:nad dependent epimerase dehydratase [Colletotrichum sojae]
MGQEASKPKPGTKLQVVAAGLPRTGTASLSKALEILLGGPVHHGGTQITRGPESEIRSWIRALEHTPVRSPADEKVVDDTLRHHFSDGYAATVDVPGMLFTEELLQLHPGVLVVCTVRDPDAWVRSIQKTGDASLQSILSFALFLVPTMRWFPRYIDVLSRTRWHELFPHSGPVPDRSTWDVHQAWLKRTVPADQLLFFDVKEGWGPLCKALGKPVPHVPFPRINDGDAIEALAKEQLLRGAKRWAVVFGTVVAGVGAWWWTRD